jgi:hypothetical protein
VFEAPKLRRGAGRVNRKVREKHFADRSGSRWDDDASISIGLQIGDGMLFEQSEPAFRELAPGEGRLRVVLAGRARPVRERPRRSSTVAAGFLRERK